MGYTRAHGNDFNIRALASKKVGGSNGTRGAKPKVEEDNSHCTCLPTGPEHSLINLRNSVKSQATTTNSLDWM